MDIKTYQLLTVEDNAEEPLTALESSSLVGQLKQAQDSPDSDTPQEKQSS